MQQRTLGKTGWSCGVIGFGAWGIGGQWGPVEPAVAIATLQAAVDAGVNFFDTADAYGEPMGTSEELIGRWLSDSPGLRARIRLASKVGNWGRRHGHPLPYTHPVHIEGCCDASLFRLKTDHLDLYQSHLAGTEHHEVFLEAFDNLRRKGKILAFGVSTRSVETARAYHRDGKLAAVQLDYSYLNRAPEKDLLPWCREQGIGTIIRGPLAQGVAAGKFTSQTVFTDWVRQKWNQGAGREEFLAQVALVEKLRFLEGPNRSMAQAALQFVLSHPAVTLAIPGAKSPEQARANAAAGAAAMSAAELAQVRQVTDAG